MSTRTPRKALGRPIDPQARAERTRLILAAARRCFLRSGFHAASTADISREAGVSVANMYQYFPSKEDLVLALVEEDLDTDLAFFATAFVGHGFLDSVENALAALAEAGEERAELGLRAEIFAEALRNARVHDALARSERRLAAALETRVAQAAARGEIALLDGATPADVAMLLLALADGVFSAAGLGLVDRARAARGARTLLARALAPL